MIWQTTNAASTIPRARLVKTRWRAAADQVETTESDAPDKMDMTTKDGSLPNAPRVSVGLPVYNGEPYLGEALDTLLNQTFEDYELVISDNASADRTEDICRAYASSDPRVRYYRNAENLGAAYNFNRVLQLSRGEFFRWTGADDVCAPNLVEACVEVLESDLNVAVAYPRAVFIDAAGRVMRGPEDLEMPRWSASARDRGSSTLRSVFRDGRVANVLVFGMVRTSILRAVRPLGNYFASDRVLVSELAFRGGIAPVGTTLAFYRRHALSSSGAPATTWKRSQQAFYDPRIKGRVREELQFRRHYIEAYRAVAGSPLGRHDRLALYGVLAGVTATQAGRSVGRRLGLSGSSSAMVSDPRSPHWKELLASDGGEPLVQVPVGSS